MKLFGQYKGLKKENYVLFFGRIATSLGAMVIPMLTMILSTKMEMTATEIATVTVLSGIFLLPMSFIGGKMTDHYNKKKVIMVCDILSISMYLAATALTLILGDRINYLTILLVVIAASGQTMELPCYNALIADITPIKDRPRAYSLQYLGQNIGSMLAPSIAGFLISDSLWLVFLISACFISCSTLLIRFKVQDIARVEESKATAEYQNDITTDNIIKYMLTNRTVALYILIYSIYMGSYFMYAYLLPLDLATLYEDAGALYYGTMSSLSGLVIVLATPILTKLFMKVASPKKTLIGFSSLLCAFLIFLIFMRVIPLYYLVVVFYGFAQTLTAIADGPYISSRVSASHRGRVNSINSIMQSVFQGVFLMIAGLFYDSTGSLFAWIFVFSMIGVGIVLCLILIRRDRLDYPNLYDENGKSVITKE